MSRLRRSRRLMLAMQTSPGAGYWVSGVSSWLDPEAEKAACHTVDISISFECRLSFDRGYVNDSFIDELWIAVRILSCSARNFLLTKCKSYALLSSNTNELTSARKSEHTMIEVKDVKKHYGEVKAVDGVSFTCPDGQITGLLG